MIDTHSHLDSDRYDQDRDEVIKNALKSGIKRIINISSDLSSINKVISISNNYEEIYATVGIQPHSAYEFNNDIVKLIIEIAKGKKVVAIGEIGLDYHYNFSLPEIQRRVFREQIKIAKKLKLPLIVHSREAFEDTINILKEENAKEVGGVIHCFTDDMEKAKAYTELGFHLGIGGAVTFKNTKLLQEAIRLLPLENIILETDCPYMTPSPHRGQRNEPAYLKFTAKKIAQLKEFDVMDVEKQTTMNAVNLFRL